MNLVARSAVPWINATVIAVLTAAFVGCGIVVAVIGGFPNLADATFLLGAGLGIALSLTLLVVCPITAVVLMVFKAPSTRLIVAALALVGIATVRFLWRFDAVSPFIGDKELLEATIWSALFAGQLVHTSWLSRNARGKRLAHAA